MYLYDLQLQYLQNNLDHHYSQKQLYFFILTSPLLLKNIFSSNLINGLINTAFIESEVKTYPIPTGAFKTDLMLLIFAAIEP